MVPGRPFCFYQVIIPIRPLRCAGVVREIRSKRIPNLIEAKVAEVLFVDGGEVRDASLDQEERGPPIVGAAAGEVGFAEFRSEQIATSCRS